MNARRSLIWIVILVVVVAGFVAFGRGARTNRDALDPDGVGSRGLKAVLDLARAYGADVRVETVAPDAADRLAILVSDELSDDARDTLQAWVAAGGTLVVADPGSPFAPRLGGLFGSGQGAPARLAPGDCTIAPFRNVTTLVLGDTVSTGPTSALYRAPAGSQQCFTEGPDAFAVVTPTGRGNVVALGSFEPFTNSRLDDGDNAVLAVDLLAPTRGVRVAFLEPIAQGRETLWSIISPGVKFGLLQLIVAFVVYALWRARRLGRPVLEDPPIEIASSDLTIAVGNLLARSGSPDRAAQRLRDDARRELASRLGVPGSASPEQLASVIAVRADVSRDVAHALLGESPVTDDQQLVTLASGLHSLRQEVHRGHR